MYKLKISLSLMVGVVNMYFHLCVEDTYNIKTNIEPKTNTMPL